MTAEITPRTLDTLDIGEAATVAALHSSGLNRRRMMDLGILPGARIVAEMRSPLGEPTAYRVRGALVALRRNQQREIEILLDDNAPRETQ